MKNKNPYYRLSNIYRGMKTRCYNKNRKEWERYGGRGITICDEWLISDHRTHKGWNAFKEWALKNGYNDNLTLDRIDNNKGYSPTNCRWVDYQEQANNKRNNHKITFKGETKTIAQWGRELKIDPKIIRQRINKCTMTEEKALQKGNLHLRMVTYKGKTQSLKKWCIELGLNYYTVHSRITKRKWTIEKALETK